MKDEGKRLQMAKAVKTGEAPYFEFRGVRIDNFSYEDIYRIITNNINNKGYICLNDVTNVIAAAEEEDFRLAIKNSLISIPDGTPLAWYGRLLGSTKIERISGVELMKRLMEQTRDDFKHFLLGDTEKTISRVIDKASGKNARLKISGFSPPFKEKFSEEDNRLIIEEINRKDPDIIWVAFGGGKQERWMYQTLPLLNRGIMIGVGAAFRYYIGDFYIPPVILQRMGLQWFFRMLDQPARWWKNEPSNKIRFVLYFPGELIKARKKSRVVEIKVPR